MPVFRSAVNELYSLERLSANDTFIHRLHPSCKLLGTAVFIIAAASFGRYDLGAMIPLVFYPAVVAALSETPRRALLKHALFALPFCLFVGVANLFFDADAAFAIGGVAVSYGTIALVTLCLKTYLCVAAALLLAAVSPLGELTAQLRAFKIPGVFVVMFEMTYRYIGILSGEAASMLTAYSLRAGRGRGVDLRHAGGFAGSFLLRSFDRAERVYSAMVLRGYPAPAVRRPDSAPRIKDAAYLFTVCAFCAFVRFYGARILPGLAFR